MLLIACSGGDGSGATPPAALVEFGVAQAGQLTDAVRVSGEVRPLDQAELAAGADGPVARVTVREGDRVSAGDILLELDLDLAGARAARARAEADEARLTAERAARDLARLEQVDKGVLAEAELDAARTLAASTAARQAALDAAAREARALVARHRLRAPFDGVVAARRASPGDWVSTGQPLITVVSVDAIDIRVDVAAAVAAAVRVGDRVELDGGRSGRIVGVVPALDPDSRTALVRVEPDGPMVPGMAITVQFELSIDRADAVLVPRDALVLGPVETRVIKSVDGEAASVSVEVLASTADQALVSGDLADGDRVVVRGNERLRAGQALREAE